MTPPTLLFAFAWWGRVTPGRGAARGACHTCGRPCRAPWDELARDGWFASDDPVTRFLCPRCVPIIAEEFAA